jgi:hypothetical protein
MQDNFHRPADHEAKMARADLFKCAQYSFKLFKMIGEDQELEGWVQAKITKAADYIASVYHYMEYEMKISEYGSAIESADMYSESIRRAFAQKLTEAKEQAKKAKAKMAAKEKDLEEAFDDKAKVGDKKKTATGELTKTDTGVIHKNTSYHDDGESEEKSGKGKKSHAKSQSASEKKSQAPKLKQSPKSAKTWGMKDSEKFDNRDKEVKEGSIQGGVWTADAPKKGAPYVPVPSPHEGPTSNAKRQVKPGTTPEKAKLDPRYKTDPAFKKEVDAALQIGVREGKKPDFLDMDKDGDKKEPMKKAVADKKAGPQKGVNPFAKVKEATAKCNHTAKGKSCPEHGLKECGGMYEGDKFDPLKHVKNPTKGEKTAAKDVKRGSYGDRAAMLKSAEKDGRLKG